MIKLSESFAMHLQCRIAATSTAANELEIEDESSALELDSHADLSVVGKHARILERSNKRVSVSGFSDAIGKPLTLEVVNAALAHDCEYTGQSYILIIRNALYMPTMPVSLIPPFMMRLHGLQVNECPKFMSLRPSEEDHSVYIPEMNLRLPLKLDRTISYLPCRMPSDEELNQLQLIEFTPVVDTWNPHSIEYQEQEEAMVDFRGKLKEPPPRKFIFSSVISRPLDPILLEYDLTKRAIEGGFSSIRVSSVKTATNRKANITPDELSKCWNIGLKTARKTLQATTMLCPRNVTDITLNRRYTYNDRMLRYRHLATEMFSDTMFASKRAGKSIRNYSCAQIFATEFGWGCAIPLVSESMNHTAFKTLFKTVGVPIRMIMDGAKSQIEGETQKICIQAGCTIHELEKGTPSSNRAERYIQDLKHETRHDLRSTDSRLILWCFCLERRVEIKNATASENYLLRGDVPSSYLTGDLTDISHLCYSGWYEWVKFRREGETAKFPFPTEHLGRCLGPAINKGNAMSQRVMTERGEVLPVQTLRTLTQAEIDNPSEKKQRERFDEYIRNRYGDSINPPDNWVKRRKKPGDPEQYDDPEPMVEDPRTSVTSADELVYYEDDTTGKAHEMPDADDFPDFDMFINAEVLLPQNGEHMKAATVIGRASDKNGNATGSYSSNPILNTHVYDVMFPDGAVQQYAANIIAENLYSQIDEEGQRYLFLDYIIDHKSNELAVQKDDAFIIDSSGRKKKRMTTKGWSFLVLWKDGTHSWLPLKDLKESYPIEVAEYAVSRAIDDQPAFSWWVPFTLKKRDRVIMAVKSRVRKKTHKYGIEVPMTVEDAYRLDTINGNQYWRNAISKEMRNILIAFDFIDDERKIPNNLKKLGVHLIFDVKMDMTRKARLVAEGHKTSDPEWSTYAGVVSRESVRIAFTYAALNGLDILTADIQNAYLTAPTSEKFYIVCGLEFGSENVGRKAIVKKGTVWNKVSRTGF